MKQPNIGADCVSSRNVLVVIAKGLVRSAALLVIACTTSGQHAGQAAAAEASHHAREATPSNAQATQQHFLDMFARSYFPGRTGQLLVVPREGDFITRPDPDVPYMHGSPWSYDIAIPVMFIGPAVKAGTYSMPATQQDVAPTLAAAFGVRMPPTSTGRVLPVLKTGMVPPRVVVLIVLDGMRRDYFDRYATLMPTLTALRQRGAWFTQAQLNILPSNTAVGHSTIATGT
ncbi:MAG TPA: alkaline phosphatase family protein, partial [Steroidobacteraceae bacterium]|nr:alkaline phosphatase family protein [Steroidobacteraceae bacterium]